MEWHTDLTDAKDEHGYFFILSALGGWFCWVDGMAHWFNWCEGWARI